MTWFNVQLDISNYLPDIHIIYSYSSLYNCDIAEDVVEVKIIQERKFSSTDTSDDGHQGFRKRSPVQ